MHKMTTCLWFDGNAEEAARFYTSVFKNSKLGRIDRYPDVGQETHGRAPGSVMTVEFEVNGQQFLALNAGPMFKFTEAVSFMVPCESQEEIDYHWDKLTEGGDENAQNCGWLKDKYGLSWQVFPAIMLQFMREPGRAERVMNAFMKMKKIDLATIKAA